MANALKCDKCGIHYEPKKDTDKLITVNHNVRHGFSIISKELDLCETCEKQIAGLLGIMSQFENENKTAPLLDNKEKDILKNYLRKEK